MQCWLLYGWVPAPLLLVLFCCHCHTGMCAVLLCVQGMSCGSCKAGKRLNENKSVFMACWRGCARENQSSNSWGTALMFRMKITVQSAFRSPPLRPVCDLLVSCQAHGCRAEAQEWLSVLEQFYNSIRAGIQGWSQEAGLELWTCLSSTFLVPVCELQLVCRLIIWS